MQTILTVIGIYLAWIAYEVAKGVRLRARKENFDSVRKAVAKTDWPVVQVTWHGWFRTRPRMLLRHPDGVAVASVSQDGGARKAAMSHR